MRKAEVHETPTLFALVHRAAEVCDPSATEEGAAELLRRFEDRDEPVGDPAEAEQAIAEAKGAIDPQDEDPVAMMTAAVATYLAYRRDEVDDERVDLLVLAARAEFDGKPPEPVASWLAEQGLQV
jgi:3-hydroxy-3-methylglutaryl CoA synthase